jgi:hypothetical protein
MRTAAMRPTATKTLVSSGLFWKMDLGTAALLGGEIWTVAVTTTGVPSEVEVIMEVMLEVGVEDVEENVEALDLQWP